MKKNKKICIIGAGTYGSYLINSIMSNGYKNIDIILVEVGCDIIKNESEIGYKSFVNKSFYKASQVGRYFGLGGTSSKWGGQLLFFSNNDCKSDSDLHFVKEICIKYRDKVLSYFFKDLKLNLNDVIINDNYYAKKGLWLNFNKRNLFNFFKIKSLKNVEIFSNYRVTKINHINNNVRNVTITNIKGENKEINADIFYLTAGAIESVRLLSNSKILNLPDETKGFADHVSMKAFQINNSRPIVFNTDLKYNIYKKSLITNRIIGEINNSAYYITPVFNLDFTFFQILKNLIFKKQFSFFEILKSFKQFIHIFPFIYHYLIMKNIYVYKNWILNIDIESDGLRNKIYNSTIKDKFNEFAVEIDYEITCKTINNLIQIKNNIKNHLINENINFIEFNTDPTSLKLEDTYHPYKLYDLNTSLDEKIQPLKNLYVFNTGILNRAGGINPTAVIFCHIEKHVIEDLHKILNITN